MTASPALRNSTFDILPLTGGLGAEILNIDLSQPQPEHVWAELRGVFVDYGVIFFRDQKLTPDQQLDFAGHFGRTSHSPAVKSLDGYDDLAELRKEEDQRDNVGNGWHTDQSAREHPVRATILLAREVPKFGGDTCFISTANAYAALSPGLKHTLEGLRGFHSGAKDNAKYVGSDATRHDPVKLAEATHPVVVKLPENGKKALYVNPGKTIKFEGWTEEESNALLKFLYQHCQKPEFFCRFRWREGSLAMWDNYQTWHYAVNDYHGQRRVMHRTTVVSDLFN